MARWWWPTLVLAGFGAVVGFVLGHDHPDPGLSQQGLLVIALAAVVFVLLTVHRRVGPGALARATAEFAVVALGAALLTLAGDLDEPPANSAVRAEASPAATEPKVDDGDNRRPGIIRVAAGVARAVTKAIRAVAGAVGWLVELWRQADATTDRPNPPPPTTTPKAEAMAPSPALLSSTRRPL
jgi:hypothetical protein